jgi:hypothetical protein
MTATAVNTRRVEGRRVLRFASLEAIAADVEAMAGWQGEAKSLGNWSGGQNLAHVAVVMNYSIDGFPKRFPAIVRFFLRLLIKRRILTRPMSPGFRAPKNAGIMPPEASLEEGIVLMRAALGRLKAETKREPSPFLGPLTAQEWEQLHCRHAELHLSFIVPAR